MLIVMDKSTHEEHLSQPLPTNNKQFELAVLLSLVIREYLMMQIQKTLSLSQNEFLIRRVLFKLLIHQVLTKSKF